jgi:hypothetical protein
LAQHRNLTLTMLIEELALEADRRLARKLTDEARARYCAADKSDIDISTRRARGLTAPESASTSKNKRGARVRTSSCRHLLQGGHDI